LLAGGAAAALLAGVATAELGLAPLHRTVEPEAALAFDSGAAAAAPERIEADLSIDSQAPPAAVIVPVSATTPAKTHPDAADGLASKADRDRRHGDDGDTREYVAHEPAPTVDDGPQTAPEARPEHKPDARDLEQDRDPAIPAADPQVAESPPAAPG